MWLLIYYKTKVGKALNSSAILADAACSRACVYLSVVLFVASVGFELTGIGYLDSIGALLIAWFSWKEGREAFDKAKGLDCSCACSSK
jgi:divalent metal cation (Fe/Co/Zn/Cd) transporter